jgi:hypothetical protein
MQIAFYDIDAFNVAELQRLSQSVTQDQIPTGTRASSGGGEGKIEVGNQQRSQPGEPSGGGFDVIFIDVGGGR